MQDDRIRVTVQVLNGSTGQVREVVARVQAADEQGAVDILFANARKDDYYYRFLGMSRVIEPTENASIAIYNNQTYWEHV